MGKRRKLSAKSSTVPLPGSFDPSQSSLNIRSYEDVADSEDEFHLNRDKILLEESPARKTQRKLQAQEQFFELSDEEVLGIPDEDSDIDYEESSEEDELQEGEPGIERPQRIEDGFESTSSADGEEEGGEGWGDSKRDYYDADQIETEADALEEEREALRLQKKQLQGMAEADFGFDEVEWLESEKIGDEAKLPGDAFQEVIPQLEITDSMTAEEKSKILTSRYPEFEPLAKEFLALQPLHEELVLLALPALSAKEGRGHELGNLTERKPGIVEVKASALGSYLAVLSMYFALVTSGPKSTNGQLQARSPIEIRDHPVMDTLLSCRNLWKRIESVPIPDVAKIGVLAESGPDAIASDSMLSKTSAADAKKGEVNEIAEKRRRRRKTKAQKAAELALADADARRAARLQRTKDDLARISGLASTIKISSLDSGNQSRHIPNGEDSSDFGEENLLTSREAAEKAQRKKGLRFYTSQIAQKSNKRDNAGRDAGGDADIPYRERLKDRQARLNTEAEARGKKKNGAPAEALGRDSDEEDKQVSKEVREGYGSDDYYDLVASRSKTKKASKAAFAEAQKEAATLGAIAYEVEEVGPDGKRAISYAIEKNKGLTPKRKKDVRNPRVKKRKKFEEKKKKLGSIKPIYKGGEGRGGYGGELTGIKTNLVKSVKL